MHPIFRATTGTLYEIMSKIEFAFYGYLLHGTNPFAELWMCLSDILYQEQHKRIKISIEPAHVPITWRGGAQASACSI